MGEKSSMFIFFNFVLGKYEFYSFTDIVTVVFASKFNGIPVYSVDPALSR